jgi:hypothetical protein
MSLHGDLLEQAEQLAQLNAPREAGNPPAQESLGHAALHLETLLYERTAVSKKPDEQIAKEIAGLREDNATTLDRSIRMIPKRYAFVTSVSEVPRSALPATWTTWAWKVESIRSPTTVTRSRELKASITASYR